jgi:undecaprenyl diphosphate synthase
MNSIDPKKLPKHVAIIMDGNGRWAKKRSITRVRGHQKGAEAVRQVVQTSREIGIPWLSLYAFSEENWKRPQREIQALMDLLKRFLKDEQEEMMKKGIRLKSIGRTGKLPEETRKILFETMERTAFNTDMVLTLALSYGSRQEITDAMVRVAEKIENREMTARDISEQTVSDFLYASDMPDPDLLIRTSGEYRVSNFLLWQIAYTEFYITPTLWPDFGREEYLKAIREFQKRERRFGATTRSEE